MPRGGKRPNAGRKKKWGDMPTIRFVRIIPAGWAGVIDATIENLIAGNIPMQYTKTVAGLDPDDAPQLTERG